MDSLAVKHMTFSVKLRSLDQLFNNFLKNPSKHGKKEILSLTTEISVYVSGV